MVNEAALTRLDGIQGGDGAGAVRDTVSGVGFKFVLKVSYGNDSIALIRWAHEAGLDGVVCLYNDTGWARADWMARVERGEALARSYGFAVARTTSMGLPALVRKKSGWPRSGMQFCTEHLKILPTIAWLDEHDPERMAISMIGVRREESEKRRTFPAIIEDDPASGGRTTKCPLIDMKEAERNALVLLACFEVLPHRSKECSPCINANKSDLRRLTPLDIAKVEALEQELGFTKLGKPRLMFRPAKKMGALGIREIVRWANSPPGAYATDQGVFELEESHSGSGCDAGMCGS